MPSAGIAFRIAGMVQGSAKGAKFDICLLNDSIGLNIRSDIHHNLPFKARATLSVLLLYIPDSPTITPYYCRASYFSVGFSYYCLTYREEQG